MLSHGEAVQLIHDMGPPVMLSILQIILPSKLNLNFLAPKKIIEDVDELFAVVDRGKSKGCPCKLFLVV
jgi:hypothetical protein